ncbi:hypothetical protein LY78DRAFT_428647 [Colletotrichum sublineola]|nr:hypothetical protein LY78DRAFT_428647 [Colletotrichum sublineola]
MCPKTNTKESMIGCFRDIEKRKKKKEQRKDIRWKTTDFAPSEDNGYTKSPNNSKYRSQCTHLCLDLSVGEYKLRYSYVKEDGGATETDQNLVRGIEAIFCDVVHAVSRLKIQCSSWSSGTTHQTLTWTIKIVARSPFCTHTGTRRCFSDDSQ